MDDDEVDPSVRFQEVMRQVMPQVQRLAPALAETPPENPERPGIDMVLRTEHEAKQVEKRVKDWLSANGLDDRVGVWLWTPGSIGEPKTAAGREVGRELRLERKGVRAARLRK
jgi:hypothetical protein